MQLIRNLTPHGHPVLRVGGVSADRSWWPIKGYRKPIGIWYDLTPAWAASLRGLAQAAQARLILGLNLEADRPTLVRVESHELVRRIGRRYIDSLQIGNEPNLYRTVPWYALLNGRPVPQYLDTGTPVYSRPPSWGPADYAAEIARLLPTLPRSADLRAGRERARQRRRGMDRCVRPVPASARPRDDGHRARLRGRQMRQESDLAGVSVGPAHARAGRLPSTSSTASTATSRSPAAAVTASASTRWEPSPAAGCAASRTRWRSALWVLDALFSMDRAGVNGVNLHAVNGVNALFVPRYAHGRWRATVDPWYYGALMFAQAAPAGARLLPVSNATHADTRVWATLGRDHAVRVLVINDSIGSGARRAESATRRATVGGRPRSSGCAHPAAPTRRSGVTLGGRSFGRTTTGAPASTRHPAGEPPGRRLRGHAAARQRRPADLDQRRLLNRSVAI